MCFFLQNEPALVMGNPLAGPLWKRCCTLNHWSTVRRRDLRQAMRGKGSRDPWKPLLEWIGESVFHQLWHMRAITINRRQSFCSCICITIISQVVNVYQHTHTYIYIYTPILHMESNTLLVVQSHESVLVKPCWTLLMKMNQTESQATEPSQSCVAQPTGHVADRCKTQCVMVKIACLAVGAAIGWTWFAACIGNSNEGRAIRHNCTVQAERLRTEASGLEAARWDAQVFWTRDGWMMHIRNCEGRRWSTRHSWHPMPFSFIAKVGASMLHSPTTLGSLWIHDTWMSLCIYTHHISVCVWLHIKRMYGLSCHSCSQYDGPYDARKISTRYCTTKACFATGGGGVSTTGRDLADGAGNSWGAMLMDGSSDMDNMTWAEGEHLKIMFFALYMISLFSGESQNWVTSSQMVHM